MRCKVCNKNVGALYNGKCTACMSLSAKDKNDKIDAMLNAQKEGVSFFYKPERLAEPGGFARIICEDLSSGIKDSSKDSSKVVKKTSSGNEDLAVHRYLMGDFSDKDKRAFKPTLRYFANKYSYNFEYNGYQICKANQFGTTEKLGGQIVESRGGLIVFKPVEFYDPNNITPSMSKYTDYSKKIEDSEEDDITLGIIELDD